LNFRAGRECMPSLPRPLHEASPNLL